MAERVRVLVADDHRLFRELLEVALGSVYETVSGASTLHELESAFTRGGFEVAVLDVSWGDEGPVTPRLRHWIRIAPSVRVILLTAFDDYHVGQKFLEMGVSGYLGKRSDFSEVFDAIEAVMRGESYLGKRLARPRHEPGIVEEERLPSETLRVLGPLAEGWSRKQIASTLHLHIKTIDYHIKRIKAYYGAVGIKQPNWRRLLTWSRARGGEGQLGD